MRAIRSGCPVLAFIAAACAGGSAGEGQATVRDSAGVEIVENRALDAELPRWRLSAQPRLTIGTLEGEPAYQFDGLRGAMMHRERILVIDRGSRELRFFDRTGKHLRTVGRKGGGPGEFEQPGWIGPHAGDSIAIYDGSLRRISLFDAAGTFGRAFSPELTFGTIIGRLADGSFVARPGIFFGSGDVRSGPRRDPLGILRVSPDGERLDTLATYPGVELMVDMGGEGQRWIRVRTRPLGLDTQVAADDSSIYVGTGDAWIIDVLDREGSLRRSIRRTLERRAVTSDVIARHRNAQVGAITDPDQRRQEEQYYATAQFPERLPAHGALRVDGEGFLWVQDFVVGHDEPSEWTVLDPDGRITGRVSMPSRFTVHEIGSDFVLGRVQDDLDVEYLVVYGLERPRAGEIAGRDRD